MDLNRASVVLEALNISGYQVWNMQLVISSIQPVSGYSSGVTFSSVAHDEIQTRIQYMWPVWPHIR